MDEEAQRRERALWGQADYERKIGEAVEERDDLQSQLLALAKECDARYGKSPTVPPLPDATDDDD